MSGSYLPILLLHQPLLPPCGGEFWPFPCGPRMPGSLCSHGPSPGSWCHSFFRAQCTSSFFRKAFFESVPISSKCDAFWEMLSDDCLLFDVDIGTQILALPHSTPSSSQLCVPCLYWQSGNDVVHIRDVLSGSQEITEVTVGMCWLCFSGSASSVRRQVSLHTHTQACIPKHTSLTFPETMHRHC